MKIKYSYEPFYPIECAALLARSLASPTEYLDELAYNHIDAFLKQMRREYPSQIELLNRRIAPLKEISDYILTNLSTPLELLKLYFEEKKGCQLTLGIALSQMGLLGIDVASLSPNKRHDVLAAFIHSTFYPGDDKATPKNEAEFIQWIENENIFPQDKWTCLMLYHNAEKHQAQCKQILDEATKLYCSKKEIWQEILENAIDEFKFLTAKTDTIAYLKTRYHIELTGEKIQLSPSLACFNSLSVAQYELDNIIENDTLRLTLGYMISELSALDDTGTENAETLSSQLKAISDARRLEILKLLRHESLCSQEIADRLSLTTGTVSHHMSELVSSGFVCIDKNTTHYSYSLIANGIKALIDNLEKQFLS